MPTEYRAQALGQTHEYSLDGTVLSAESPGAPGLKHQFQLDGDGVKLVPQRSMHRAFWIGLIALVLGAWTLGFTYYVEGSADAWGWWSLPHVGFVVLGVVLLIRYRRPVRMLLVTRDSSNGILVYCEHGREQEYEAFCDQLREAAG